MDFSLSATAQDLLHRLKDFLHHEVLPKEAEYFAALTGGGDFRKWRQPAVMEQLKAKARAAGLWNLFLPDAQHGAGLSTLDYAPLAEAMGWSFLLPEICNCSAPDSGNMEGHPLVRQRAGQPLHVPDPRLRLGGAEGALAYAASGR